MGTLEQAVLIAAILGGTASLCCVVILLKRVAYNALAAALDSAAEDVSKI